MPADTPTLNRAANQIKTVGAARLSLDDVRDLVRECGGGPNTTPAILAIRMSRRLCGPVYYVGCADSGPNAPVRYEFMFSPDSRARVQMAGRKGSWRRNKKLGDGEATNV